MKCRLTRRVEHVACNPENRNETRILSGYLNERDHLESLLDEGMDIIRVKFIINVYVVSMRTELN